MIFSLIILKNYIERCVFWSCRHFVDRLICKYLFSKGEAGRNSLTVTLPYSRIACRKSSAFVPTNDGSMAESFRF